MLFICRRPCRVCSGCLCPPVFFSSFLVVHQYLPTYHRILFHRSHCTTMFTTRYSKWASHRSSSALWVYSLKSWLPLTALFLKHCCPLFMFNHFSRFSTLVWFRLLLFFNQTVDDKTHTLHSSAVDYVAFHLVIPDNVFLILLLSTVFACKKNSHHSFLNRTFIFLQLVYGHNWPGSCCSSSGFNVGNFCVFPQWKESLCARTASQDLL